MLRHLPVSASIPDAHHQRALPTLPFVRPLGDTQRIADVWGSGLHTDWVSFEPVRDVRGAVTVIICVMKPATIPLYQ